MHNLSYENEFDLHLNENASKTNFNMKCFTPGTRLETGQRELGNGLFRKFVGGMLLYLYLLGFW